MGPEAVFTESPLGIAFGVSSDIHLVLLVVLIGPKSFLEGLLELIAQWFIKLLRSYLYFCILKV